MNFWKDLIQFLMEQRKGLVFSRQMMIEGLSRSLSSRKASLPESRYRLRYYTSVHTLDAYRRFLTRAGYLEHVGRGKHKRVRTIPRYKTTKEVFGEANLKKGS